MGIFYMRDSDRLKWGRFGYRAPQTGKFEIHFRNTDESGKAFEKGEVLSLRSFTLDVILHIQDFIHFPVQTIDRIRTPKINEFCVLRNWVYNLLKNDIKIFRRTRRIIFNQ